MNLLQIVGEGVKLYKFLIFLIMVLRIFFKFYTMKDGNRSIKNMFVFLKNILGPMGHFGPECPQNSGSALRKLLKQICHLLECWIWKTEYVGKSKTLFQIRLNNLRKHIKDQPANIIPACKHFNSPNHDFSMHRKFTIIEQKKYYFIVHQNS